MKALLTAGVAVGLALTIGVMVGQSQEPSSVIEGCGYRYDNAFPYGGVTLADISEHLDHVGETAPLPDDPCEPPCVEWKVFDGTNDPDYAIIGLDGQWKTPTGGMWLVPSDHPMIDAYRQGTPIPMIPCPG